MDFTKLAVSGHHQNIFPVQFEGTLFSAYLHQGPNHTYILTGFVHEDIMI